MRGRREASHAPLRASSSPAKVVLERRRRPRERASEVFVRGRKGAHGRLRAQRAVRRRRPGGLAAGSRGWAGTQEQQRGKEKKGEMVVRSIEHHHHLVFFDFKRRRKREGKNRKPLSNFSQPPHPQPTPLSHDHALHPLPTNTRPLASTASPSPPPRPPSQDLEPTSRRSSASPTRPASSSAAPSAARRPRQPNRPTSRVSSRSSTSAALTGRVRPPAPPCVPPSKTPRLEGPVPAACPPTSATRMAT